MNRLMTRPATRLALRLTLVLLAPLAPACDRGPSVDEVLYQRAHDAGVSRRGAEAEALYRQLLQQHPSSKYSSDAHVALAELAFNAGAFDTALAEYGAVLAIPTSKSWGYALFKQGWFHLNSNRPDEARTTFERVIAPENDARIPEAPPQPPRPAAPVGGPPRTAPPASWSPSAAWSSKGCPR
jgi:TolA-binding protein